MIEKTLQIGAVTKQYRAGKLVFSDISTEFKPGEAVLLVGPNGSGKTTFLKLLSINTFPTEGKVLYGDLDIHRYPYRYLESVGLVHDEEVLPQHISAIELLEWVLRSRGVWNRESRSKMDYLLDHLELDEARHDEIGTYSTGMRKKAQIAVAFITEPPILILDEPLRGLDKSATLKALELFRQALNRGGMLLMASHVNVGEGEIFQKVMNFPLQ